jgi:single-stranded-DNA-specific exonuclease
VDRLFDARAKKQKVVIFGDYDVDGITSTAILLDCMQALRWDACAYLPDRVDEGYGLTSEGVDNCIDRHAPNLLLAADCGSTSVEIIAKLQAQGIDVIVLDHHQVSDPPPEPVALINPQLNTDGSNEFHELCAAGLAFKLAHGLIKQGRANGESVFEGYDIRLLLDLVALGTIADMVPLMGENRILAAKGLEQLNRTGRIGLSSLIAESGIKGHVGSSEVGFQLGPRLNAAGRLESAMTSLDLLTASDQNIACDFAARLDLRNRERQRVEKEITQQVTERLIAKFDPASDYVITEGDPSWSIGVVGIVASRIQKEYYRPTFILGGSPEGMRGSGRSIKGFDLAAALCQCSDLICRHGGHAMAAGVSLSPDNIDAFGKRLNEIARTEINKILLVPTLRLDGQLPLSEFSYGTVASLEALQPTGQGVPAVQLAVNDLEMNIPVKWMGAEKQHAKMNVTDGKQTVDVLYWNAAGKSIPEGRFNLAVQPSINVWRGRKSVQLKLLDWQPSD